MIQIQNDFVLGFFDTHVRIKENNFPEAQFDRHKAWVQRQDMTALREDWLKSNPDDQTVQVMLETSAGEIEVALYPKRAPISVANFLTHVDGGHYDGASFYRVTRLASGTTIGVVQGGLAESRGMGLNLKNVASSDSAIPPIAHETTDRTGITNETGTLAMARLAPGTASSEFFFNVEDNPALDFGNTSRNPDGQGYATFGRVLRGLPVLWNIQAMRSERSTDVEFLKGQMLNEPVIIHRAYRVK
jgi:peptidyl-prolyl cis-trans isomerase A (cyclophilin A)